MKASGIKKEPRFDTRRTSRGIICFKNCNFKMGIRKRYPSIDSLKEISRYFSVSIDELLSGDQLVLIVERKQVNLNGLCDCYWIYRFAFFDAYFSSIVFQTG